MEAKDLLNDLNPEQRDAVTHESGPLLIVAGAGTGKTTVITRKINWLIIEKKFPSDSILAVTFTDKAANEMEERVQTMLPYGYLDFWILTFHAFCERILREHAFEIGLSPNFKLFTPIESWLLARESLDRFDLKYFRPLGNQTKFLHALIEHFSKAKDEDLSTEEYLEFAESQKLDQDQAKELRRSDFTEADRMLEIAKAYHAYQQLLLEHQVLDFGDLIFYTLKLLRTRPHVCQKIQRQFRAVLVDEFQDTNFAQYELIKLICRDDSNITVVADDDQSIYAFRSASLSNILEFKKDFPLSKEVVLTTNYRSPQNILDLAYGFIQQNNPNRLEAQLSQVNADEAAKHLRDQIEKRGKLLDSKISKHLKSPFVRKGTIEVLHFQTDLAQAEGVVSKIATLQKENDASWNDFAILIRANDMANPFCNGLSQAGIPYQFLASKGLFSKPAIIDLLSYFRVIDQVHESRSMYRVLTMPLWNIPMAEVQILLSFAQRKGLSLCAALSQARFLKEVDRKNVETCEKMVSLIKRHVEKGRREKPSSILFDFLHESGLFSHLTSKKDDPQFWEELSLYNQFLTFIQQTEQRRPDLTVHSFLEEIYWMIESGDEGALSKIEDEGPESVKILTIHAAKGLEFDTVFVVSLVDKRFPSMSRRDPIEIPEALIKEIVPEGDIHLQEERRLFYVAITRAKKNLYLSWFDVSLQRKGKKKGSRFLFECGFLTPEKSALTRENIETIAMKTTLSSKRRELVSQIIPNAFSFTQLSAFQTCPWQYYLGFVLKIPRPGNYSMSFGRTLHNTLKQFFERFRDRAGDQGSLFGHRDSKSEEILNPMTFEELLALYESQWIDEWYPSDRLKKEYFEKGKTMLRDFYETDEKHWPVVKYIEKGFRLAISEFMIKGVIDRVDRIEDEQNAVEIIDYKTGSVPPSEKSIDWQQLLLYAYGISEVFGETAKRLTFYYLFENKKFSRPFDSTLIPEIKTKTLLLFQNISSSDFKARAGYYCKFCDYRSICEFRAM